MAQGSTAIGIDIGGTGIKGGIVDLETGALLSDRIKLPTPQGGRPNDIATVTTQVLTRLDAEDPDAPIGVCFPAVVKNGKTMSAANISQDWIGFDAEAFFEKELGHGIRFVNDADAAGYAEVKYGAAKGRQGVVILTTLGTGIGTAIIVDGLLVPNTELGHLEIDGYDAESRAAYSAKEREKLDWKQWAKRLNRYYAELDKLFTPDLYIVGGGVSKNFADFAGLLTSPTPFVAAAFRNNSGILGAAALAAGR
ncbi:polyphosphate--glucose phosphotransferase [Gryllotalpicola sp.]|uniref:polyphosphate--glucose phosphotransferase n=1 Tax=Gryllotalpicola sp. TaxID=1932787 RepID=UPI00262993E1|nr:ROK family protein [Gryllotalpicola sp.]